MSKVLESLMPDATEEIRPFNISVPQEAIADLRARLRATRFPNEQLKQRRWCSIGNPDTTGGASRPS